MKPRRTRAIIGQKGQRKHHPAEGTTPDPPKPNQRGWRKSERAAMVRCRCWCDKTYVEVPALDVSRGVTVRCGRPGCEAPRSTT